MLHIHVGPDYGHTTDEIERRESPATGRILSHDLSVTRFRLYCCAATTALNQVCWWQALGHLFLELFPFGQTALACKEFQKPLSNVLAVNLKQIF